MEYKGYLIHNKIKLKIIAEENKLISIEFVDKIEVEVENSYIKHIKKQLLAYLKNEIKKIHIEFDISGSDFEKKVYKELIKIPYGETKTYGEIAKLISNPKSYRAVGKACNKNKLVILIPCHRVIGANGDLKGFAGGLDVKKELLLLESNK